VTAGWSLGAMTKYSQHCLAHNQLREWVGSCEEFT